MGNKRTAEARLPTSQRQNVTGRRKTAKAPSATEDAPPRPRPRPVKKTQFVPPTVEVEDEAGGAAVDEIMEEALDEDQRQGGAAGIDEDEDLDIYLDENGILRLLFLCVLLTLLFSRDFCGRT